jgi:hypothetical protein
MAEQGEFEKMKKGKRRLETKEKKGPSTKYNVQQENSHRQSK